MIYLLPDFQKKIDHSQIHPQDPWLFRLRLVQQLLCGDTHHLAQGYAAMLRVACVYVCVW